MAIYSLRNASTGLALDAINVCEPMVMRPRVSIMATPKVITDREMGTLNAKACNQRLFKAYADGMAKAIEIRRSLMKFFDSKYTTIESVAPNTFLMEISLILVWVL